MLGTNVEVVEVASAPDLHARFGEPRMGGLVLEMGDDVV